MYYIWRKCITNHICFRYATLFKVLKAPTNFHETQMEQELCRYCFPFPLSISESSFKKAEVFFKVHTLGWLLWRQSSMYVYRCKSLVIYSNDHLHLKWIKLGRSNSRRHQALTYHWLYNKKKSWKHHLVVSFKHGENLFFIFFPTFVHSALHCFDDDVMQRSIRQSDSRHLITN